MGGQRKKLVSVKKEREYVRERESVCVCQFSAPEPLSFTFSILVETWALGAIVTRGIKLLLEVACLCSREWPVQREDGVISGRTKRCIGS